MGMFDDDDPGDLDWSPTNLRAMSDKKRRKTNPLTFMTLNC